MLMHSEITEQIIKAYYHVYNHLGYGFLEKVENALAIELRKRGLTVRQRKPIKIYYEGQEVGKYFADLLVNGCVIVEVKAAETLVAKHHAQLLNYLKATEIDVGLLVNFGPKPEFKRKVFETARASAVDSPETQPTCPPDPRLSAHDSPRSAAPRPIAQPSPNRNENHQD